MMDEDSHKMTPRQRQIERVLRQLGVEPEAVAVKRVRPADEVALIVQAVQETPHPEEI